MTAFRLGLDEATRLAGEREPPNVERLGPVGVVAEVAVIGVRDRAIPPEVGSAVYRIAQEALTNVAKHAGASHVSVILGQADHEVRLIVEDDGRGFDTAETMTRSRLERRLGLPGMRERAALVGGTVTVESKPGAGTSLFVRLPTRQAVPPTP